MPGSKFLNANQFLGMHENLSEIELLSRTTSNLKLIHKISTAPKKDLELLIRDVLQAGLQIFSMEYGIVSEINDTNYRVCDVVAPTPAIQPNDVFVLSNTYCQAVIDQQETICYTSVGAVSEMKTHPVYVNMKLESYIGAPIYVGSKIYGTLNFSSTEVSAVEFSEYEREFIELLASVIGSFLELKIEQDRVRRSNEEHGLLNKLLMISNSLSAKCSYSDLIANLDMALLEILSMEWLTHEHQGGLFLARDDMLELVHSQNLDEGIRSKCKLVKKGQCLCGLAFESKQIVHRSSVNSEHLFSSEDSKSNGYYNVPLIHDGVVLGVMVLVLKGGHQKCNDEIRLLNSCSDILARMIAQYDQYKRVSELIEILDQSGDFIGQINLQGENLYVNTAFRRATGLENAQNVHVTDLHTAEQMKKIDEEVIPVLNETGIYIGEVGIRGKNGEEIPCSIIALGHRDEKGEIERYSGIFRDITELKNYQEQLEQSNRVKSQFLANVSHEIRTPMNAIIGLAEVLQDCKVDSESRSHIKTIQNAGEDLLHLINDVLDMSKIEAGELQLSNEVFQISDLSTRVLNMMNSRALAKDIQLKGFVTPDIKDSLLGDPYRLRQILINLLGNAVKFTPEGGEVQLRISLLDSDRERMSLRFEVSDTGPGIPEDKREEIFEQFAQIKEHQKSSSSGTGLGLTITRQLLELMDGKIRVQNNRERGCTFCVELSLPRVADQNKTNEISALQNLCDGKSALIIDHSKMERLVLKAFLNKIGIQVLEAKTLEEAIESVQNEAIDLVLLSSNFCQDKNAKLLSKLQSQLQGEANEKCSLILTSYENDKQTIDLENSYRLRKPVRSFEFYELIQKLNPTCLKEESWIENTETRLLLVEDNPVNSLVVEQYLKKHPVEIVKANNGEEAIECFMSQSFDWILMDIRMDGMNGYEATNAIREIEKNSARERTPVIACSANVIRSEIEQAYKSGCDSYLSKPVQRTFLLEELSRHRK